MENIQQTQPIQTQKMTPKFFFLSLGKIVALIVSVTAFINLAFETLNFKFPDALNATYQYGYASYNYDGARMFIAMLIIFFPVFLIITKYWKKVIRNGLGKVDTGIKKWMVYLILFLSALVVAIDLVTLVRYFVSGEITTRFILKVGVALLVAMYVGVFYFFELTNREKLWGFNMALWSFIKSSILVLALIIWSFSVIGTPGQQRTWRLDDKRVQDLQNIQWQVINYWQQKEKLPTNIIDISNPISNYIIPVDPEFEKGNVYEYKIVDAKKLSFELCATFSAKMPKGWVENKGGVVNYPIAIEGRDVATSMPTPASYPYPGSGSIDSWNHDIGNKCFTRTIDKDMYPPYQKPLK